MSTATPHDAELATHDHSSSQPVTLFDGQKNFWRARQNLDLRVVEHGAQKVIEVIAYSSDLGLESPRIYIESKRLYSKLDSAEIDEKINAKREELARARKRVPVEEMKQNIVRDMAVAYILARLQIVFVETNADVPTVKEDEEAVVPDMGEAAAAVTEVANSAAAAAAVFTQYEEDKKESDSPDHGFQVQMLPVSGDSAHNGKLDMVLKRAPAGITEIVIPRRRKTTLKDFHNEMRALRADHAKLNNACVDASRKAGLAVQSTDAFKGMLRNRSSLDDSHLSVAQKRWIWAGRKVMLQNYVAAVHVRLERYSLSAVPTESMTKQGQELKDKLASLSGGAGRGLRASQSGLKLPSLLDSSKDARRGSRSSKDGRGQRSSFSRNREMDDFSKSLSLNVQGRVESRMSGLVDTRKSFEGSSKNTVGTALPSISPDKANAAQ